MSPNDHSNQRYIELQSDYNFLCDQISQLSHDLKVEDLRPKESYRLKRQIEELKREREKVEEELEKLDKSTNSEQLYRNLFKLGYEKQAASFVSLIQKQSVSAFLIHGSVKYGQRWLLNTLVDQYVPASISGRKIKIELSRAVQRNNIQALWREIARRVGCCQNITPSPAEIIEGVYRCWQTEDVLLVFHDVNMMPSDYLEQLIKDFWQPLASQAHQASYSSNQHRLLMFLVDYDGSVGNLDHLFCPQVDLDKPNFPVKPPTISKFTSDNVSNWILQQYRELPQEITYKYEDVVAAILAESEQGIPEEVLAGIFQRCGYNYYEEVERLWKL